MSYGVCEYMYRALVGKNSPLLLSCTFHYMLTYCVVRANCPAPLSRQSEGLVQQLRRTGLVTVHHHGNQHRDCESLVAMNNEIGTPFVIIEDQVRV